MLGAQQKLLTEGLCDAGGDGYLGCFEINVAEIVQEKRVHGGCGPFEVVPACETSAAAPRGSAGWIGKMGWLLDGGALRERLVALGDASVQPRHDPAVDDAQVGAGRMNPINPIKARLATSAFRGGRCR